MCSFRIKGRINSVHRPQFGSISDAMDGFYAQLEREYDCCPSHGVNIIIGDLNAQVGQKEIQTDDWRSPADE